MIISFGLPAVVRTAGKPEIMLLPATNETMKEKIDLPANSKEEKVSVHPVP
jgi:hypothetical protein